MKFPKSPSLRRTNRWILGLFFIFAGLNHFINPSFYLPLIPAYFPYPELINVLSGLAEIILGMGFLWSKTRPMARVGIIILLVAFIPTHVYFIQIGPCITEDFCVPEWLGWVRLLLIHPLLLFWAWKS